MLQRLKSSCLRYSTRYDTQEKQQDTRAVCGKVSRYYISMLTQTLDNFLAMIPKEVESKQ